MKSILLTILKAFVGIIVVGAVSVGTYMLIKGEFSVPCEKPLAYSVGTIDNRFGVSSDEFASALNEASSVWNIAAGKEVLVLDPASPLTVSLIYDERQAATKLGDTIDEDQRVYDAQRARVDALINTHDVKASAYESRRVSFEEDTEVYENKVSEWNAKGGAPQGVYEDLEKERKRLARVQGDLSREADALNQMSADINVEVEKLNALAGSVNAKVDTYNAVAGSEFDQGQYVSDDAGTRITIYEFKTRDQLVRALAHEFGHALGILHTNDPQSLMYPYNSGKDVELHSEDITALKQACELP